MKLADYLREDLVLTQLAGRDTESVIEGIASGISRSINTLKREEVRDALLKRERVHSTSLGQGVAVPHATLKGLDKTLLTLAITAEAVPAVDPECEPARLFFVLLSPPGREREHIKLLARISRIARRRDFSESVAKLTDPAQVVQLVHDADEAAGE